MGRTIQVAGIAVVVVLAAIAAIPSRAVLTVDPVDGHSAVISGWIDSNGDARVSLDGQAVPWQTTLRARGLRGFIEAGGGDQVRVRARIFKGPLALSELRLVGARISLVNEAGVFSGRTR